MVEIAQTGNAEEGKGGVGMGQGWGRGGAGMGQGPCQQEKPSVSLIGFSLHPHVTWFLNLTLWHSCRRSILGRWLLELAKGQVNLNGSDWKSGSCFQSAVEHSHLIPVSVVLHYTRVCAHHRRIVRDNGDHNDCSCWVSNGAHWPSKPTVNSI